MIWFDPNKKKKLCGTKWLHPEIEPEQEPQPEVQPEPIIEEKPLMYKLGTPNFENDPDWTITLSEIDFPWWEIKFGDFSPLDCY